MCNWCNSIYIGKSKRYLLVRPTLSGLYINYYSYIADNYKKGLLVCLTFTSLTFWGAWCKFHAQSLFSEKLFSTSFVDKCVFNQDNHIVVFDPLSFFKISFPFMAKYSTEVKKKLSTLA